MKLFEKNPFTKWKFVQRLMHRRRASNDTGTDKYKTYSRTMSSKSGDSEHILEEPDDYEAPELPQEPRSSKSRATHADTVANLDEEVTGSPLDSSSSADQVTESTSSKSSKLHQEQSDSGNGSKSKFSELKSKTSSARIKAWEESHGACEAEPIVASEEKPAASKNPFQRNSKLRNSLKELKQKSMSHMGSMRDSMRRRNTKKYDNLDHDRNDNECDQDDEIVDYDRSPVAHRKQDRQFGNMGTSLRRSLRRSGRMVVQGMSQIPAVSVAQGMAKMTLL